MRWLAKRTLSEETRRWLRAHWDARRLARRRPGFVRFGSLRLARRSAASTASTAASRSIATTSRRSSARARGRRRGRVLEIKDDAYTRRFGAVG